MTAKLCILAVQVPRPDLAPAGGQRSHPTFDREHLLSQVGVPVTRDAPRFRHPRNSADRRNVKSGSLLRLNSRAAGVHASESSRLLGMAKGSTFSNKGPSRSSSKPMELATSLPAAARRSDMSLFRAWRRRGIGCNPMSPRPSCAPTRRHGPTWRLRRQLRSPKRKNHSSPQSSLMFWRSASQANNNWAAGLHMWKSHSRPARSCLTSSNIPVRSRSDMRTIRFACRHHLEG